MADEAGNSGKVLNFDHLVFWVANSKTAASYFVTRLGFRPLAEREPSAGRPVSSHVVALNKIIINFESPSAAGGALSAALAAHGDSVRDVALSVRDVRGVTAAAARAGAVIETAATEERDDHGVVTYAVLRTYGSTVHTLVDRSQYSGVFWPGYSPASQDPVNEMLPKIDLEFIDHVEANLEGSSLEDCVAWYENNLKMHKFWCVDYAHDLTPFSCINSASVINDDDNVLLSMNEAAQGVRAGGGKVPEFTAALGAAGVEHVALYTDDIVATMQNLRSRGAEILTWPSTYYDMIRAKLAASPVRVAETIDQLQENHILIDFDERGYMLQAFTKHLQARPTVFVEIIQRRNHRGFGAQNYKWVFEAIEMLDGGAKEDAKTAT